MRILEEWDNGAPESTQEETDAFVAAQMAKVDQQLEEGRARKAELVARDYDEDRAKARLKLLRTQSDVAFFTHVLAAPANAAQRDAAESRVLASQTAAEALRSDLGDPDQIIDQYGDLPAQRRERNLESHMRYWRHRQLREWATTDRRRFTALLKMPMPEPESMCSECEAPADWHGYDLSLRLFHPPPEAGSQAESIARTMPGWWERCPASTAYQIEHKWGGSSTLPDFDGEQWIAMLPPMLRAIFVPAPPKPRAKPKPKSKPLAVIAPGPLEDVMQRLTEEQVKHPNAQLRRGDGDTWELWPS